MFNFKNLKSINISEIVGEVFINVHDLDEVIVKADKEEIVDVSQTGERLYVKLKQDKSKKSKFGNIVGNFFGGNININGGNIVINNGKYNITNNSGTVIIGNTTEPVNIDIYVPKDTIDQIIVSGKTDINIDGISDKLEVDFSGQLDVDIKNIKSIVTNISGQCDIDIKNLERITTDISGQCDLDINGHEIERVIIDASGQCDIDINGHEIERVIIDASSQCDIDINSKIINNLELDVSGMCDVCVKGEVINKNIYKSGMSNVKIK